MCGPPAAYSKPLFDPDLARLGEVAAEPVVHGGDDLVQQRQFGDAVNLARRR